MAAHLENDASEIEFDFPIPHQPNQNILTSPPQTRQSHPTIHLPSTHPFAPTLLLTSSTTCPTKISENCAPTPGTPRLCASYNSFVCCDLTPSELNALSNPPVKVILNINRSSRPVPNLSSLKAAAFLECSLAGQDRAQTTPGVPNA